jgi:hypothetical protein
MDDLFIVRHRCHNTYTMLAVNDFENMLFYGTSTTMGFSSL